MIIIEVKLNKNTPYTVRQEATFKRLVGEIAAANAAPEDAEKLVNIFVRGSGRKERFFMKGSDVLPLKKVKLLRISGHNTPSPEDVEIAEILKK